VAWTSANQVLARDNLGFVVVGDRFRMIPLPESSEILEFAVSSDGNRLAAVLGDYEETTDHPGYGTSQATGLWLMDIPSGEWTRLVDPGGLEWQPYIGAGMTWSPDNRRIAYYPSFTGTESLTRTGLTVIDTWNGEETRLHDQGGWPHAWSPDGRYLAYTYEAGSRPDAFGVLGIMGADGEVREKRSIVVRGMAWSGDNRLLVTRPSGLNIFDPETLKETELLTDGEEPIHVRLGFEEWIWSPSGRYLAVATPGDRYVASSLLIIDTQEGIARVFYDRAEFAPLAWLTE
jgi:hypothetical protein